MAWLSADALSLARVLSLFCQAAGFMYSKEEMLQIYRDGHFKNAEFADKFQQVPNATTPEILIPLALLPVEAEEAELRLNPVVVGNPAGPGGRGRGFGEREGGRGKGKGERGKGGDREGKGGRDGWGRAHESGDVRNSGGGRWDDRSDRRGARDSNGERDSETGGDKADRGAPKGNLPVPPAPKDWFYRDLHANVQGPFSESQISEWFSAGYLPADLQMRPSDGPADVYTPLNELVSAGHGEPPFVRANRIRNEYEAQQERARASGGSAEQQQQQNEQDKEAAARAAAAADAQARAQAEAAAAAAQEESRREAERQAAELQAQRQAEEDMHRRMIDEARRRAEEEARRVAEEERRRILEESRRATDEEARRQREELQQRLQAEAAMMQRQQAEQLALRQQAMVEEAQRQQLAARHEQQRVLSMLPPASADGNAAGNALLSLLQGPGAAAIIFITH